MNTYVKNIRGECTLCSSGRPADGSLSESHLAANVYLPAAEVYPQDELPPCNKVELRGVKEVIRSFCRFTKSGDLRLLVFCPRLGI
jgi:hypothetical protein